MSIALIDTSALLKMIYASAIAGVSVAVVFSLVILGVTRASDMRRLRRGGASAAYGALAVICLVLSTGIVVYGLILVTRK
jgi:Na+/H+-dicarboxylate symporter